MKKIVLGLSGGVDSAVSASLLKDDGWEVHGLYLVTCSSGGEDAAREAARQLGIPLHVADVRDSMEELVCRPFARAYLRGETPNPCILCNPAVKFKALLDYADSIGAEYIATGHYARTEGGCLYKGHPENDQSYMLCRLTPEMVSRLVLPLGSFSKSRVRAIAAERGMSSASKPDSMEICFIPDGDYAGYIEELIGTVPPEGYFIDASGNKLGRHKGIHHYTLGQRRGLGISAGHRIFVSEIRPEDNTVVLSDGDGLYLNEINVSDMNWISPPEDNEFFCTVRVRHSRAESGASASIVNDDSILIRFEGRVRAPTPGQSAALYSGDKLLGGGYII